MEHYIETFRGLPVERGKLESKLLRLMHMYIASEVCGGVLGGCFVLCVRMVCAAAGLRVHLLPHPSSFSSPRHMWHDNDRSAWNCQVHKQQQ